MLILFSFEDIFEPFLTLLETVFLMINGMIYDFVNFLYQIYLALASAQLFSDETIQGFADRIYILIGVVSLFLVAYALLQAVINPDAAAKGENSVGKVVPNILKVVILLAFTPALFKLAYNVQTVVLAGDVIPRLVIGDKFAGANESIDAGNGSFSYKTAGRNIANEAFIAFLQPGKWQGHQLELEDIDTNRCGKGGFGKNCSGSGYRLSDAFDDVSKLNGREYKEDFNVYASFAYQIHGGDKSRPLVYHGIFQLIAGIFLVYVFFNYCIDIAVRAVKLAYYQIIAPIPILTIMIPGQKKIFDTWLKSTLSTFFDVFIRIFIIFFGILLINMLPDVNSAWDTSYLTDKSDYVATFAKVFLIIGILIFIKEAPKMISEITGIKSGSFKLGIRDKLKDMAFVGGLTSSLANKTLGAATGALGGAWGAKTNKGDVKQGIKYGASQGWKKGGSQFNAQRQAIYSDAYGGKGTAGWFGGQRNTEKIADDIKKTTKNQYRDQNKAMLEARESAEDFQRKLNANYTTYRAQHADAKAKIEAEIKIKEAPYREAINTINDSERATVERHNALKSNLEGLRSDFNAKAAEFEANKATERQMLQMEYARAQEQNDSNKMLAIATQIQNLESQKYTNAELEGKISDAQAELQRHPYNKEYFDSERRKVRIKMEQDEEIDKLHESLKNENKYLVENSKDLAQEVLLQTRSEYAKEHPRYRNILENYNKYEREIEVGKWMQSPEAHHLSAVMGKHTADIAKNIHVDAPKGDK